MDDPQIVVHIPLVLPFSQSLSFELLTLELPDDGIIMTVPLLTLGWSHPSVVGTSPSLQYRPRVNLLLFVSHLQVIDHVHVLDDAHLLLLGSEPSLIIIIECLWQRIFAVIVEVKVTSVGIPHAMWRLMMQQQAERLLLVAFLRKPVQRKIGGDVRDIPLPPDSISIADKVGIVIVALSDKDVPVVKARRDRNKMPFADHGCLISRLLQQLGESLLRRVKPPCVIGESIGMAMFARQHTGTGRAAE